MAALRADAACRWPDDDAGVRPAGARPAGDGLGERHGRRQRCSARYPGIQANPNQAGSPVGQLIPGISPPSAGRGCPPCSSSSSALVIAPLARWLTRRRRWTAADSQAARAHAAWAELGDDLRDLGLDWRGQVDTPRRAAATLVATRRLAYDVAAEQALSRLSRAEELARYAARPDELRWVRSRSARGRDHSPKGIVPLGLTWPPAACASGAVVVEPDRGIRDRVDLGHAGGPPVSPFGAGSVRRLPRPGRRDQQD